MTPEQRSREMKRVRKKGLVGDGGKKRREKNVYCDMKALEGVVEIMRGRSPTDKLTDIRP